MTYDSCVSYRSRDEPSTYTTWAQSLEGSIGPFTFSLYRPLCARPLDEQFDEDKSMHDSGNMSVKYFEVG